MIRVTDLAVRADSMGVKICSNTDRSKPGYVEYNDLIDLIEMLDTLLEKWNGKPMRPSTHPLGGSSNG